MPILELIFSHDDEWLFGASCYKDLEAYFIFSCLFVIVLNAQRDVIYLSIFLKNVISAFLSILFIQIIEGCNGRHVSLNGSFGVK
jgi:hypothetical protein